MNYIGFQIVITPLMTGALAESWLPYNGNKVYNIKIDIHKNRSITTFISEKETPLEPICCVNICNININNDMSNSSLVNSNVKLTISDNKFIESPFIKLFRTGDAIEISCYHGMNQDKLKRVFKGQISSVNTSFDIDGVDITLVLDTMTMVLQESTAVQFEKDWNTPQLKISTITTQQYELGVIMEKLINGTAISKISGDIKYCYGESTVNGKVYEEQISLGLDKETSTQTVLSEVTPSSKGSALSEKSWLYIYVEPTASKLACILSPIYPYQRLFYCDVDGSLVFSPLSNELAQDWNLNIMGAKMEEEYIPAISYDKVDNLMSTNRAFMPLDNVFSIFNKTKTPSEESSAFNPQSISLPSEYFERSYDIARSTIGTRTDMMVSAISALNEKNSGIFNILNHIHTGEIEGLVTKISTNNNIKDNATATQQSNKFYAYSSAYTANQMAISLFKAEQWIIKIPLVSTVDKDGELKKIPLNKTITIGTERLFVYAYSISWGSRTILTLKLCRPYTLRAFWADKVREIQDAFTFGRYI